MTESPSSSAVVPAVQVSVLDSDAVVGLRLAEATVGAVLSMVTDALLTDVPVSVPSLGVTVQRTASPLLKDEPVSVLPVAEMDVPFTVQL